MRDFNHSINVLVNAFLKGTLLHTDACGCAAGNIIADACGYKISTNGHNAHWSQDYGAWFSVITVDKDNQMGIDQINKSGYTRDEISRIENAFEKTWKVMEFTNPHEINSFIHDPDGFKGLMCVVDVLAEIHGISLEQKAEAKAMFVKETI